jgi:signal transduction histidine kinase/CheY-like chemotaxis protein
MVKLPIPRPWGYVVAAAGVALATVTRLALSPYLGPNYPFATYFFLLLLTVWICGVRPAVFALVLDSLAALGLLIPSLTAFGVSWPIYLAGLLVYVFVGSVSIAIIEMERRVRRRLEGEIEVRQRAEEALRDADRRKDEFLAMLAHELRNPLAPISNATTVMALTEDDREAQRWSREVIERQVQHLSSLVNDLLDVSRITQSKINLARAPLVVSAFVQAAIDSSRPLLSARRHRLEVSLPQEPLRVDGDLTRLTQVVQNLLNNAAKYTPDGGHIALSVERDGGQVNIRLKDDGVGIPAEMLSKVFELFTQVDRSLDRSDGGLGIGLTLVRRLVEMHGGSAEAHSDGPGRGSEFIVRLPLLIGDVSSPARPHLGSGKTVEPTGSRRVLVVDDSTDSAATLARLLLRLGHEVEIAHDGPSACREALRFRPDLALLDIGLPGMDGYAVAQTLRHEPSLDGITLVAVTGYGSQSDRRKSAEAGFDNHLVKPVEFEDLMGVLRRMPVGAGRR